MTGRFPDLVVHKVKPKVEPPSFRIECSRCPAVLESRSGGAAERARNDCWSVPRGRHERAICPDCLQGRISDAAWAARMNEDLAHRKQQQRRERADRDLLEEVCAPERREMPDWQKAAIARSGVWSSSMGRYG